MKNFFFVYATLLINFCSLFFLINQLQAETNITNDIKADTTWTIDGSPYILNGGMIWNYSENVTLTIEAGVEVQFIEDNGHSFAVGKNGALIVNGTEDNPVLFTSTNPDKTKSQLWYSLSFNDGSRASESVIDWAIFEGAGCSDSYPYTIDVGTGSPAIRNSIFRYNRAGIYVRSGASPQIEDCTFENNDEKGIYLNENYQAKISSCRFEDNGDAAIYLKNSLPILSGNNAGDNQYIYFDMGILYQNASLRVPGILDNGNAFPYLTNGFSVINSDEKVTLTIDAGVEIQFEDTPEYRYSFAIGKNTALLVRGTEENPVLFTSANSDKTQSELWRSIYFSNDSNASESIIDWAIIEGAGYGGDGAMEIATGSPLIRNSIFRYNENGIYAESGASPQFENCTFVNNDKEGIRLKENYQTIISSCRFENNGEAAIYLWASLPMLSGNTAGNDQYIYFDMGILYQNANLKVPGILDNGKPIPYLNNGANIKNDTENVTLTIDAGVEIQFEDDPEYRYHFQTGNNTALVVQGTKDRPVLFTSADPDKTKSDMWYGVKLGTNSRASESVIEWAIFEGAGYGGAIAGLSIDAGSPVITNSIFRHNQAGIVVDNNSKPTITSCTFTDNDEFGIIAYDPGLDVEIHASVFQDNGEYGIKNNKEICIDAMNNWWGDSTGPLDDSDIHDCVYDKGYTYHNPDGKGDPVSDNVIYNP